MTSVFPSVCPVFVSSAMLALQLLEGKSLAEATAKLQSSFVSTFLIGTVFWTVANLASERRSCRLHICVLNTLRHACATLCVPCRRSCTAHHPILLHGSPHYSVIACRFHDGASHWPCSFCQCRRADMECILLASK